MQFISRLSIRWKIFILCIVSIGLSSVILVYSLSSLMFSQTYNKVVSLSEATMLQYAQNIRRQLLDHRNNVNTLAEYKPLRTYLNMKDNEEGFYFYLDTLHPAIDNMFSRESSRLRIYSDAHDFHYSSEFGRKLSTAKNEPWYQIAQAGKSPFWLDDPGSLGLYNYICAYYYITYNTDKSLSYAVASYISEDAFDNLLEQETPSKKHFILMNESGQMLYCESILSAAEQESCSRLSSTEHGDLLEFGDDEYILLSCPISTGELNGIDWIFYCLVPYSDILTERAGAVQMSMMLAAVCIILTCIFSLVLSSSISRSASKLLEKIGLLKAGNFNAAQEPAGRPNTRDELTILNSDFDYMAFRIRDLINKVYITELDAKEEQLRNQQLLVEHTRSELLSLQRQINPHYLFNTLESISMRLLMHGDTETAAVVELFGRSFRTRVYSSSEMVTLRAELEFVQEYIAICNFRFSDMISLEIDADDLLLDVHIPKLILQPLVENAVTHGIEDSQNEATMILLEIRRCDGRINIRVSDNGSGMTAERLAWLHFMLENPQTESSETSIGLRNVSRRLWLLYGNRAHIHVESIECEGTTVEMIFPIDVKEVKDHEIGASGGE